MSNSSSEKPKSKSVLAGFPCCCLANVKMTRFELYSVALYSFTTIFVFADQNLMSPNLSHIAEDFGFTEEERDRKLGGDIALAFFIVGVPIAFLIGFLVDKFPRVPIFAFIALVSGASSLATYYSKTYHELFICRAVTGVAVGGALPVVYSLLSDMVPVQYRSAVNSLVGAGMGFGIALGQFLAGFIGSNGDWRTPFLLVSIPSFVNTVLLVVTLVGKEPPRGGVEPATLRRKTAVTLTNERRKNGEIPALGENETPTPFTTADGGGGGGEYVAMATLNKSGSAAGSNAHHSVAADVETGGNAQVAPQPSSGGSSSSRSSNTTTTTTNNNNSSSQLVLIDNGRELETRMDEQDVVYKHKSDMKTIYHLMRNKTAFICCLQGIPGSLPWGMVSVFFNDFLSNDCGLSIEAATGVITMFGIGALIGMLFGGWYGQRLTNNPRYGTRWNVAFLSFTELLGVIPLYFLINHVDKNTPYIVAVLLAMASGGLAAVTGPNVKAILQNVTLPEQRGVAFAGLNLTDDLGKGFGPFIVAAVISSVGDRRKAFTVTMIGWLIGGVLNWCMHFTIVQDEREAINAVERKLEGGEDLLGVLGDTAVDINDNRTDLLEQMSTSPKPSATKSV